MNLARKAARGFVKIGVHNVAITLCGVSGMVWPPPSVREATLLTFSLYFWLVSMIIGGILCSYGRAKHATYTMCAGLALIIMSVMTYVVALIPRWPESLAAMFLLAAFCSMLAEDLQAARRSGNADLAVRGGNPSRSDLVTFARDSLSRRGNNSSGIPDRSEDSGEAPGTEGRSCER